MDFVSSKVPRGDNVIQMSKDYGRFKRITGNRPIYPSHVAYLVEVMTIDPSMMEYDPILINERFEIIDGQHRVEAAKELNLPIYYLMRKGLRLKHVQGKNSGVKVWTAMDYAQSFAEIGNVDYKIYLEMKSKYPLSHDLLRYILSRGSCSYHMFKNNKFTVVKIMQATDFLDKLSDFKTYFPFFSDRSFVLAFERMFNNDDYNHEYMMDQLSKHPDMVIDAEDASEYLQELQAIYNMDMELQNQVRFY